MNAFLILIYIHIHIHRTGSSGVDLGEFFERGRQQTVTFIELDMPCGGYDLL